MRVENAEEREERKELFRKFAGTAIENSHGAIKQVWVALFAGGTFALIKSFDELMGCAGFFDRPGTCNGFLQKVHNCPSDRVYLLLLLFTLYFVYILTFYRFYVGNVRVFDMRYIEVGKCSRTNRSLKRKISRTESSSNTSTKTTHGKHLSYIQNTGDNQPHYRD